MRLGEDFSPAKGPSALADGIAATYGWALGGAPWSVLLVPGGPSEPQELDADQFLAWMDRVGPQGRLLSSPASACPGHRYVLVNDPARLSPRPSRSTVLRHWLLARAPLLAEWLQTLWQRRWLPPARRRWRALQRPTARQCAATQPSGEPALILGMHWLALGGAESFAVECVHLALHTGRPVYVLCEHPSPAFYGLPEAVQVLPLYLLPPALRGDLIVHLAQAHPGSLIHIHHCISVYAALGRLRQEVPAPLQVVDSLHIDELRDGGFVRVSSVWGAYLDCSHVISAHLSRQLLQRGGLQRDLRLGYLLPDAAPAVMPRPRLPASLAAGRLHLCMVSRLVWQKRPILTLRLGLQLMEEARRLGCSQVQLTLVGSGPLWPPVERLVQAARRRHTVNVQAATPQASELFAEADLLLQCSANEGITLTSFEALARGCLVLSTAVGAQRELIAPPFLLPADPWAVLRRGRRQVGALLADPAALEAAIAAQAQCWQQLAAAPRGRDVVEQLYAQPEPSA